MDSIFPLLALAGAVALLLWGAHMVQTGVQRAFGPKLRAFIGRALPNRLAAFLAGIGVTVVLQSSTATGLMAASFAANSYVDMVPALAIMLGANVGTALIVQVLAFDVVLASPVLLLLGLLAFRYGRSSVLHDLGRVVIGLGLMLLALHQMLEVIAPLQSAPDLAVALGLLGNAPLLSVALAAVAAWAAHSSVAVVVLIVSLATHGLVSTETAVALVLGANLGTALNPLVEAGGRAARRAPLGNLLNRLVGVVVALPLTASIAGLLHTLGLGPGQSVAVFHLAFNIVLALIALPFLASVAGLLQRLLPDPPLALDPGHPLYLDPSARETPVVALGAAAREALRLADALEQMLTGARTALLSGDRRLVAEIRGRDDVLDKLNRAINAYLIAFDPDELNDGERDRLNQIMAFSLNLEQAGDVVDRALLPHNQKRLRRGIVFTAAEKAELQQRMDRLVANLRTAATLLVTDDRGAARRLTLEKLEFRQAERDAVTRHLECLRERSDKRASASAIVLDMLRDMKVINSFIVAGAAYPLLSTAGELLDTRLSSS